MKFSAIMSLASANKNFPYRAAKDEFCTTKGISIAASRDVNTLYGVNTPKACWV
jgi:hypothetical protein